MKKHYKGFLLAILLLAIAGALFFYFRPSHIDSGQKYPYEDFVRRYSAIYDLEPEFVFGVIRTESNFDPNTTSQKNARGLMQITDETLNWAIAREGQKAKYRGEDLYDPEINIKYGCLILSLLFEEFEEESTVLAAYNAGRGNAIKWLKDSRYSPDGKAISKTPFKETTNYIRKVLKYRNYYLGEES